MNSPRVPHTPRKRPCHESSTTAQTARAVPSLRRQLLQEECNAMAAPAVQSARAPPLSSLSSKIPDPIVEHAKLVPTEPVSESVSQPARLAQSVDAAPDFDSIAQRMDELSVRSRWGAVQKRLGTIAGPKNVLGAVKAMTSAKTTVGAGGLTEEVQRALDSLHFKYSPRQATEAPGGRSQSVPSRQGDPSIAVARILEADRLRTVLLPRYLTAMRHHIENTRDEQGRTLWKEASLASADDEAKHKKSITDTLQWLESAALDRIGEVEGRDVQRVLRPGRLLFQCFELCADLCNFALCKVLPRDVFCGDEGRYKKLATKLSGQGEKNVRSPVEAPQEKSSSTFLTTVDNSREVVETRQRSRLRAERALGGVAKARLQELVERTPCEAIPQIEEAAEPERVPKKHLSSVSQTHQAAADRHGLWLSLTSPRLVHPPLHACSHLSGGNIRDRQKLGRQVANMETTHVSNVAGSTAEARGLAVASAVAHNAVTDIEDFHKPSDTLLPVLELVEVLRSRAQSADAQDHIGRVEATLLKELAMSYCSFLQQISDPVALATLKKETSSENHSLPRGIFPRRHVLMTAAPRFIIDATMEIVRSLVEAPSADEVRVRLQRRRIIERDLLGDAQLPPVGEHQRPLGIAGANIAIPAPPPLDVGDSMSMRPGTSVQRVIQEAASAAVTSQQEQARMALLAKEQNKQLLSEVLLRLRGELLFLFTGMDERQPLLDEHQERARGRWEEMDRTRRQRVVSGVQPLRQLPNRLLSSRRSTTRSVSIKDARTSEGGSIQDMLSELVRKEDEEAVASMMLVSAKAGGMSVSGVLQLSRQAQIKQHQELAQNKGRRERNARRRSAASSDASDTQPGDAEIEAPTNIFPLPPKSAVFNWQGTTSTSNAPKTTNTDACGAQTFMAPTVSSTGGVVPQDVFSPKRMSPRKARLVRGPEENVPRHFTRDRINVFAVTAHDEERELQDLCTTLLHMEQHRRRHNPTLGMHKAVPKTKQDQEDEGPAESQVKQEVPSRIAYSRDLSPRDEAAVSQLISRTMRDQASSAALTSRLPRGQQSRTIAHSGAYEQLLLDNSNQPTDDVSTLPPNAEYFYSAEDGCYFCPVAVADGGVDPTTGETIKIVKLASVTESLIGVNEAKIVERFKQACRQTLRVSDSMHRWYEHGCSDAAVRRYRDRQGQLGQDNTPHYLTAAIHIPSGIANSLQRGTFDVAQSSPLGTMWRLLTGSSGVARRVDRDVLVSWTF